VPAGPVPVAPPRGYGGDHIMAGARFLGHLDPGWWQEGVLLPASLTVLDMTDPYQCMRPAWCRGSGATARRTALATMRGGCPEVVINGIS
jgi:hypothetical protein